MYLTQNREMKQDGVWNFTLPAWVVELPDGTHFNVCPNAGACAKFCYARNGTYLFPKVRGKHLRNLELVRDDPEWIEKMCEEIAHKRFLPKGEPRDIPLSATRLTATAQASSPLTATRSSPDPGNG